MLLQAFHPRGTDQRYQQYYSRTDPAILDRSLRGIKAEKIEAIISDYYKHKAARTSNLRILEIGCAGGILVDRLSPSVQEIVGIDIDLDALSAREHSSEFGNKAYFAADGMHLPFKEENFDLVICNHVYEHMPESSTMFAEINRVLRPKGVCYFGAGNRLVIIEPHYNLPFLSWLPRRAADFYVRVMRRSRGYQERLFSLWGLRHLTRHFRIHDYTLEVIDQPETFHADDLLKSGTFMHALARGLARTLYFLVPTYIWLLEKRETPHCMRTIHNHLCRSW